MKISDIAAKERELKNAAKVLESELSGKTEQNIEEDSQKIKNKEEQIKQKNERLEAKKKQLEELKVIPNNAESANKLHELKIEIEKLGSEISSLKITLTLRRSNKNTSEIISALKDLDQISSENINTMPKKAEALQKLLADKKDENLSTKAEKDCREAIAAYLLAIKDNSLSKKNLNTNKSSGVPTIEISHSASAEISQKESSQKKALEEELNKLKELRLVSGRKEKPDENVKLDILMKDKLKNISDYKNQKDKNPHLKLQMAENELNQLKKSSHDDPSTPTLIIKEGEQSNSQRNWLPFLNADVAKKLNEENLVVLSIEAVDITPDKFKAICGGLQIKNFEVKEKIEKSNQNQNVYHIYKGNAETPIVKLSHVPEHDKIDIVLTDKSKDQDEGLFLMVVSAKKMLEELGETQFNIEHCEDKPETALKLYLIGKSLGLEPVFKDKPGQVGKTEKSIEASKLKLKSGNGENAEEKTLGGIYQEAKAAKTKQEFIDLKKQIGLLGREEEPPHASKPH